MSIAQLRVRSRFKEAAKICSERASRLPRGERRRAFLNCMSEMLRGKY